MEPEKEYPGISRVRRNSKNFIENMQMFHYFFNNQPMLLRELAEAYGHRSVGSLSNLISSLSGDLMAARRGTDPNERWDLTDKGLRAWEDYMKKTADRLILRRKREEEMHNGK